MAQPTKRKPREERDPTPDQVLLITEYVRQLNELSDYGPPRELERFLRLAKEIGFWRMRKDIERTAAYYAKRNAPPARYIGYPPSASDPAPLYRSWRHFLDTVTWTNLRTFCLDRAKRANLRRYPGEGLRRLRSSRAKHVVEGYHVWRVFCAAKGRCMHCGSLAVEGKRERFAWGLIGRRIGSLEHISPLYRGGDNDLANLGWSCLWCNHLTRERERESGLTGQGALDSGGFYPPLMEEPDHKETETILAAKYEAATGRAWKGDVAAFAVRDIPDGFAEDDVEGETWPDHEYPEATAMWRDTFG